jgi:hypothetical protein
VETLVETVESLAEAGIEVLAEEEFQVLEVLKEVKVPQVLEVLAEAVEALVETGVKAEAVEALAETGAEIPEEEEFQVLEVLVETLMGEEIKLV